MNKCIKETIRLSKTFHLLSGSVGPDNITPFADPPTHDVRQMCHWNHCPGPKSSRIVTLILGEVLLHFAKNHLYL